LTGPPGKVSLSASIQYKGQEFPAKPVSLLVQNRTRALEWQQEEDMEEELDTPDHLALLFDEFGSDTLVDEADSFF
jgi:hypothetical protein